MCELWSKPNYPGDPVRIAHLQRNDEVGDVRIQDYGASSFRVAIFLPGILVALPGDTPKVEPEICEWTHDPEKANRLYDRYVEEARKQGWRRT